MICPNCSSETNSYRGVIREGNYFEFCEHCYEKPQESLKSANFIRNKNIVAINQNPKEGVYGITDKGKHIDLKDTPYEYDPTGWKYTDKVPKKRTYYT